MVHFRGGGVVEGGDECKVKNEMVRQDGERALSKFAPTFSWGHLERDAHSSV